VKLPTPSIAARLYAIFALMAATTVALSVYAVSNARFHAALTEEFESANAGSWNVERGIYMSADVADAASARNDRNPSQRPARWRCKRNRADLGHHKRYRSSCRRGCRDHYSVHRSSR
jgi:hypothetical protein